MNLHSKSSLLILAWVSGFNKSSFICSTLDCRPILSPRKSSLIKSRIPIVFWPVGKKLYDTFYVQMPMKNIKHGTPTYQKRVKKKPLNSAHIYRKGCISPKIYHLHETRSLHSNSPHRTNMKHYGLSIWIIISTVIILIVALVSSVCVLVSDKVVKCPAKQYKWQYSIYSKAPSMAFNLSPRGITQNPLSHSLGWGQVKPGPFFLHKLISSDSPSTPFLFCCVSGMQKTHQSWKY